MTQKRIGWMLALCMATLCCAGTGLAAEAPTMFTVSEPEITYDGTYLAVTVEVTPTEGHALVEKFALDMGDAPEGALGVEATAALRTNGITMVEQCLFSEEQNGASVTRGFYFVLSPETARESLSVKVDVMVYDDPESAWVESASLITDIPAALPAEVYASPIDIALGEDLPPRVDLDAAEDADAPETTRIGAMQVSYSEAALCLLIEYSGDGTFTVACSDPATGEAYEMQFATNEVDWLIHVFDAPEAMPPQLEIALASMLDANNPTIITLDLEA